MASTYNNLLNVEEIGTGEQAGTWGDTTNTNIADTLPEAITGRANASITAPNGPLNLTYIDSNSSQAVRNLVLDIVSSGNLTGTSNVIVPNRNKQYIVENNTSGGQSIIVKTAAGTGVTIPNGRKAHVFCDGTNVRFADDFVDINGGTIDGTPIGSASPSTAVFSVATITTGNITTGNITTGNITTGNIGTLNVGTQTNKATISYTTNEARTLTIPAVSGNRTFAFLEEAQTFTANQTVDANLIFSGNGRRIIADFSNSTVNNRTIFQTSTTNSQTAVNAIPNGTSPQSVFSALNNSNATDASSMQLLCNNGESRLAAERFGTGTFQPMTFYTNGSEKMRINTSGEIFIAGTTDQGAYNLQVNGTGVWAAGPYVDGSDARLKEDVQGLDEGLSIVEKLRPVSFKYRQDTGYTKDTKTYPGFIAQDLQVALEGKNYLEGVVQTGGKYLSVSHQSLIPVLTKAIQELKTELDAVKAELAAMKGS